MKYSFLIAVLFATQTQAIQLNSAYVDDIVKALEEDDKKEASPATTLATTTANVTSNATAKQSLVQGNSTANKTSNATSSKKEDDSIPMDAAAIKAYSSVIADAAEESEPEHPVTYTETDQEYVKARH